MIYLYASIVSIYDMYIYVYSIYMTCMFQLAKYFLVYAFHWK